jgi:2-polyprenyl-3-methyl-5-hydroxy-6-metoxy-1,4-benzoquinol methylase
MYTGNIYQRTIQFIDTLGSLEGKLVVDIPAGDGCISKEFVKRGARVLALDLYPEKITAEGVEKIYADMNDELPLEDNSIDIVLCQEGIEHIHNQFVAHTLTRIHDVGRK